MTTPRVICEVNSDVESQTGKPDATRSAEGEVMEQALIDVLAPAYAPCPEFKGACTSMRWIPKKGHVPRGFCGGAGSIPEVELVLVFAEPGDPHQGEVHEGLQTAYEYAEACFLGGTDLFHRNVRSILDMCWPDLSFQQQLHKVWLTNSVLCSANNEGGHVPAATCRACGNRYLLNQLSLFPQAVVVALGNKAMQRLEWINFTHYLPVSAVAPPGGLQAEARRSWDAIPVALRERRKRQL